jgi:hypothetical protein
MPAGLDGVYRCSGGSFLLRGNFGAGIGLYRALSLLFPAFHVGNKTMLTGVMRVGTGTPFRGFGSFLDGITRVYMVGINCFCFHSVRGLIVRVGGLLCTRLSPLVLLRYTA